MEHKNKIETVCSICASPLQLNDFKGSCWNWLVEEFKFRCKTCNNETILKSSLYIKSHINKKYLSFLKDGGLQENIKLEISEHLESCQECKDSFNELFLKDIEEKISFKNSGIDFFKKNSTKIFKELKSSEIQFFKKDNKHYITKLTVGGDIYLLNSDDEFNRNDTTFGGALSEEICYFIKDGPVLTGMVSTLFLNEKKFLNRVWFQTDNMVKHYKGWCKEFIENKKITISTIKNIMSDL